MKKLASVFLALLLVIGTTAVAPTPAEAARVFVGVGVGGYYPYSPYPGYYPYYYPYYVAPPPVVYAVPPAAAPVIVAPTTYQAIAPAPVFTPGVAANQTSPTFIDSEGRTCRHFQSTNGGPAYGTACLQSDGSWRSVP